MLASGGKATCGATHKNIGGTSVTEAHISSLTDSIILLRYVETFGEMRRVLDFRALTVTDVGR